MSQTISGVVLGGVIVPSAPLTEGRDVEIRLKNSNNGTLSVIQRFPDLIDSEEIAAPIDLPRQSAPTVALVTPAPAGSRLTKFDVEP